MLADQIAPHISSIEIRTVEADDIWMSPMYHRASAVIHFNWRYEPQAVRRLCPIIENELKPFSPRPHWGKEFSMSARELTQCYEKMNDFRELLRSEFDPEGKFRNEFLDHFVQLPY